MYQLLVKHLLNDIAFRFRRVSSGIFLISGRVLYLVRQKQIAARFLMQSHRIYARYSVIRMLKRFDIINDIFLEYFYTKGVTAQEAAARTIILKMPDIREGDVASKGVILIAFTRTFGFYLEHINIDLLAKYFHIVLEPSWSGYIDPDIIGWSVKTSHPIYVQSTELDDRTTLTQLNKNLVPMSFGASNWVDYKSFYNVDTDKTYDSIYIANTNPIKRIVRYLLAVKKIIKEDPQYRACLVCALWGGNKKEDISNLIHKFGLTYNMDVFFGLKKNELREKLSASKVNILLSYKEGSNRSLFESMFVGIPVICLVENVGVNKSYINEHTGLLIEDQYLENALMHMKEKSTNYSPRQWAMKNIAPEVTTEKMIDVINSTEQANININEVQIKVNNPELSYFMHPQIKKSGLNEELISCFMKSRKQDDTTAALQHLAEQYTEQFRQQG